MGSPDESARRWPNRKFTVKALGVYPVRQKLGGQAATDCLDSHQEINSPEPPSSLKNPDVFRFPHELIRYVHGDLFGCPSTDSLAHCISADCRMGAGIAVQFKKRFKRVEEIKQQNKKKGNVATLEVDGRYIYYLITKDRASGKPTYEDLHRSLEAMKDHALCNRVTAISMPRIGCGLDRLQWNNVASILSEVFRDTGIVITVYSL